MLVFGIILYFGCSCVITTFLFYTSLSLLSVFVLNIISVKVNISTNTKTNFTLLIGALCISLLAGELYLRYIDKTYATYSENNGSVYMSHYKGIRGFNIYNKLYHRDGWLWVRQSNSVKVETKPEFSFEHRYNSDGLRDIEQLVEKNADEYRIIGIGDSFTEGVGTSQNKTWLKLLGKKLQQKNDPRKIRTINAGVGGSDPFFEYILLKEKLLKYNPDMVIVAINSSDVDEIAIRGGMARFCPDGTMKYKQGPSWEWFYSFSFIFRHIIHGFYNYSWTLYSPEQLKLERDHAADLIYSAIMQFQQLAQTNKFDLMVVFHPRKNEVISGKTDLSTICSKLKALSDIPTINLLDYYLEEGGLNQKNISDYYWPVDLHHTEKGYELWATALFKYIVNKNIIQKKVSETQYKKQSCVTN